MKRIAILFTVLFGLQFNAANAQSLKDALINKKEVLNIYYYENEPYAFSGKNGKVEGIEIDIINEIVKWSKSEKNLELEVKYKKYDEFSIFYDDVKNAKLNVIGLGSVTIIPERKEEIKFSAPYLKNVSVLISDGIIPTAKSMEDLYVLFSGLTGVTIKESIHEIHLDSLSKKMGGGRPYAYVGDAMDIPKKIKESTKYYGYIDVISFWKYLKTSNQYVKMHKVANKEDEHFGFIMHKESDWDKLTNEFFESGFGFTSTKRYREILQKYLGSEIIDKVELD